MSTMAEFGSQGVANILHIIAKQRHRPTNQGLGVVVWALSCSLLKAREAFESECRLAFVVSDVSPSASQLQVSHAVRLHLGLLVEDEYRCPRSGYAIDMLVSDARPSAASAGAPVGGRSWAVEFDGPDHFLACGRSLKVARC